VLTTLDALYPGVVAEGARSVWELGDVEVLDERNGVFMRPGLFVP
jgi:hypothetical protein